MRYGIREAEARGSPLSYHGLNSEILPKKDEEEGEGEGRREEQEEN